MGTQFAIPGACCNPVVLIKHGASGIAWMNRFDLIWMRVSRVLAFLMGMGIMGYETVADHSDRPWLYAAAVGLMGLPLARAAEDVLSRFGGSGPQMLPPRQSQVVVSTNPPVEEAPSLPPTLPPPQEPQASSENGA